jgi:microcin C transport system substrate-binding protein
MDNLLGSRAADTTGSSNWRGVKSAAVDRLVKAMADAGSYGELRDAARALDRVAMWSFWQSPQIFKANDQVSYWNKFGRPQVMPHHFEVEMLSTGFTDYGPWPLWTWWDKSLDKSAQATGR